MIKNLRIPIMLLVAFGLFFGSGTNGVLTTHATARPKERIQIPSIGVDLQIVVARYTRGTWNFNRIIRQAAYLEMRPLPGQGSNVVIAAHAELARRKPGPFYKLSQLKVNDEIIVTHNGTQYRYVVQSIYQVDPTDIGPLYQTDTEMLTLLTCDDFNTSTHRYDKRLIVRAAHVS
jgi:LPXTG-site transpeptidase (sortase) family protein